MKKKIFLLAALLLLTSTAMLFTGCPMSLKKGIVGVWKGPEGYRGSRTFETFFCFTSDGKFYIAEKDLGKLTRTEPQDYSINGNKLKIGDNELECTIKTDELTLTSKGESSKLKRVSSPTEDEIKTAPVGLI